MRTFEWIVVELSIPLVLYPIDMIFPRMRSISKRSVTVFTVIPFSHPIKHYTCTWTKLQTSCLVASLILLPLCNRVFQLEIDVMDRTTGPDRPDRTGPDRRGTLELDRDAILWEAVLPLWKSKPKWRLSEMVEAEQIVTFFFQIVRAVSAVRWWRACDPR